MDIAFKSCKLVEMIEEYAIGLSFLLLLLFVIVKFAGPASGARRTDPLLTSHYYSPGWTTNFSTATNRPTARNPTKWTLAAD